MRNGQDRQSHYSAQRHEFQLALHVKTAVVYGFHTCFADKQFSEIDRKLWATRSTVRFFYPGGI